MSLKKMSGGQFMPLYSLTSPDWHNSGQPVPYAVNLDVGINEYTFGRTTPDNKFVVSTGLVNDQYGIRMVGGNKKKSGSNLDVLKNLNEIFFDKKQKINVNNLKKYNTFFKKHPDLKKKLLINNLYSHIIKEFTSGKYTQEEMIDISKILCKIM